MAYFKFKKKFKSHATLNLIFNFDTYSDIFSRLIVVPLKFIKESIFIHGIRPLPSNKCQGPTSNLAVN